MDEEAAQNIAKRRLQRRAADYLEDLTEAFQETLPGNHSPAETILLTYLMTMTDGYNSIDYQPHRWESRRKSGWGTTLGYLATIGSIVVPFVFECRHGNHSRQLALLIDEHKPGVRTPQKHGKEAALMSLGASVLLLSTAEIFADIEGCVERIEASLTDMNDAVLRDAGIIPDRDD